MQNRDKLVREVALTLGLPQTKVRAVVASQAELVKKAMREKEPVSVYLRRVGTFISKPVRQKINKERCEQKLKVSPQKGEEPIYNFK